MNEQAADWMKDWAVVGAHAKHLPTGTVIHNVETVTFDGQFHWVSSALTGLTDAVAEPYRQQAMELWSSGKLGPVHTGAPGLKLG